MLKIYTFEFNPFGENTYLAWDSETKEAVVIDPGMSKPQEDALFDLFVQDNGLKLKAVLLTHIHVDHTFGVEHVVDKYGVKVLANKEDEFLAARRAEQARMFHLPIDIQPLKIDRYVDEGEVMMLGDYEVTALAAPGHSPGSLLYYIPKAKVLFSGDVLFRGSIGRTDLIRGDFNTLLLSIHKKILTLPLDTTVYPGHGPATTIGYEMRTNQFLR